MAIKFVSIKCPECGATLDIEEGRKQIFCSYCGTKVMIDNDNEYIYRHIDEASIKKTEAETMLRMKELEIEEKENERSRKGRKVAYIIAVILFVIGLITMPFGFVGIYAILAGGLIAEFTFIGNSNMKKKNRHVISANESRITENMEEYSGKNYNSIVALYRTAGFTNVTAVPLCDLNIFTSKKNGQVEEVTINGESDFEEGDIFPKTVNVMITYHSLK